MRKVIVVFCTIIPCIKANVSDVNLVEWKILNWQLTLFLSNPTLILCHSDYSDLYRTMKLGDSQKGTSTFYHFMPNTLKWKPWSGSPTFCRVRKKRKKIQLTRMCSQISNAQMNIFYNRLILVSQIHPSYRYLHVLRIIEWCENIK